MKHKFFHENKLSRANLIMYLLRTGEVRYTEISKILQDLRVAHDLHDCGLVTLKTINEDFFIKWRGERLPDE